MSNLANIYDQKGMAGINSNYRFIEEALTHQSIMEGVIQPYQFLRLVNMLVDPDTKEVYFECELYEYLLH